MAVQRASALSTVYTDFRKSVNIFFRFDSGGAGSPELNAQNIDWLFGEFVLGPLKI